MTASSLGYTIFPAKASPLLISKRKAFPRNVKFRFFLFQAVHEPVFSCDSNCTTYTGNLSSTYKFLSSTLCKPFHGFDDIRNGIRIQTGKCKRSFSVLWSQTGQDCVFASQHRLKATEVACITLDHIKIGMTRWRRYLVCDLVIKYIYLRQAIITAVNGLMGHSIKSALMKSSTVLSFLIHLIMKTN